jgi:N-acetylglucosamine-6-phosphate deacetylase
MKTALAVRTLFTPLNSIEDAVVIIEDDRILSVDPRSAVSIPTGARQVDLGDNILVPGFIDVHVHGGAGHDVMEKNSGALAAMERHLAKTGVTSYCPTTVTAPRDATFAALDNLATEARASRDGLRSKPAGLHLEGPFISHAKRGVHPPENLLLPSADLFEQFWNATSGNISVMTIAPELPGAPETIRAATERGVCISLGHSNATLAEAQAGIAAGARHATHTFNAMRPLDHREPGVLGIVLDDDHLTADIIVDGVHVHPEVVSLFLRAKGPDRAVLITDAISATGQGDGTFLLGKLKVDVRGNRCEFEGRLAGSVLTLDLAVRNVVDYAGWTLQQSVRLATINPARVLGRKDIGVIASGARADFAVLTRDGRVVRTIIDGVV